LDDGRYDIVGFGTFGAEPAQDFQPQGAFPFQEKGVLLFASATTYAGRSIKLKKVALELRLLHQPLAIFLAQLLFGGH
jgi:hypothetical protein